MTPIFDHLPLCDRVRESCRWVMGEARLVRIDDAGLATVASTLDVHDDTVPDHPPTPLPASAPTASIEPLTGAEADDATLVLALDAINFGSGYHDLVRKRPNRSGAQTMAESLERYVSFTGPLDPSRLQRFTTADCSQVFGQELDGGGLEELMSLFATALVDLGEWLERRGGATAVLEQAGDSAESLAQSLTEMVFYRDVERYGSATVSFYKRAQITAADLARRVRPFRDLERLTAFADNLVPHVLRMSGALHYSSDLAATIDRGELLTPGGAAEVEIRAAAVEAVERLAAITGRRPMDIDEALWTLGGSPEMKAVRRHRARSVFY